MRTTSSSSVPENREGDYEMKTRKNQVIAIVIIVLFMNTAVFGQLADRTAELTEYPPETDRSMLLQVPGFEELERSLKGQYRRDRRTLTTLGNAGGLLGGLLGGLIGGLLSDGDLATSAISALSGTLVMGGGMAFATGGLVTEPDPMLPEYSYFYHEPTGRILNAAIAEDMLNRLSALDSNAGVRWQDFGSFQPAVVPNHRGQRLMLDISLTQTGPASWVSVSGEMRSWLNELNTFYAETRRISPYYAVDIYGDHIDVFPISIGEYNRRRSRRTAR